MEAAVMVSTGSFFTKWYFWAILIVAALVCYWAFKPADTDTKK
jgi:hypothetical protein